MAASLQVTARCLLPASSSPRGHAIRWALAPRRQRLQQRKPTPSRHQGATAQQQQPGSEQQGAAPPQPPPTPSPGGGGSQGGANFIPAAILEYDKNIAQAQSVIEDGKMRLKEVDDNLEQMRQEEAPEWALKSLRWVRQLAEEAVSEAVKKHAMLLERRETFIAGLRQMAWELEAQPPLIAPDEISADWMATAGYTWALQEGEDGSPDKLQEMLKQALEQTNSPSNVMWGSVLACLILAWFSAWGGTWWGVDAYRLLHDLPDPQAAAATWLAWTAPYVGGTVLAYYASPPLIAKSVIRNIVTDQQQFYRKIDTFSLASAALLVAYCQCLVYQGLWQDVFTSWLGGSRDAALLTDPSALEDSVRLSMGTLVGSPRLPAFLLAPSSAVLTGLLEAAYFFTAIALRDSTNTLSVFGVQGGGSGSGGGGMPAPPLYQLEPSVLTATELPLVCARIAASGIFLCLEGSLTGSLWLPVGTSAAGLFTAMLLTRQSSRGGGGGSRAAAAANR